MPTPNIVKGQIAIDPYKGIFYYRNNANVLVNTSLNWSQPTDSLIQTEDSVQINSDISVSGNLTINGNTTTLNTETLTVEDNIIILNSGVTGSPSLNAGIEVERGTSNNVVIRWNEGIDKWQFTNDGISYSNIVSSEDILNHEADTTNIHGIADTSALVTLTGAQTLTNKTLVNPTITGFSPTVTLGGDLTGSVTLTNLGSGILTATIASNSVALGADTTGNYVADVTAGTGIAVVHTPGEGSSATISLNASIDNLSDVTISSLADGDFLRYSNAANAWINDPVNLSTDTVGDYVQSLVAGTGITLTNNSGEGTTPTIAVTANTYDAYGAAAAVANTAAAALSSHESDTTNIHGIADTSVLVTLADTQTLTNKTLTSPTITGVSPVITLAGDLTGSVTLTNLGNGTLTASIAESSIDNSHISATFQYVENIYAGPSDNIIITNEYVGPAAIGKYTIETSATPNFTTVTTTSLIVDNIEIDPTGANSNVQVLRFDTLTNKFIPGLASTVAALADLTDVDNLTPSAGHFLAWGGSSWTSAVPPTGMPIVSPSAPSSPAPAQLWFDSENARTFIYYDSQWVEIGVTAATSQSISKFSILIGDGTNSSYTVQHSFNTRDVIVQIYDNTNFETIDAHVLRNSLDSVLVSFAGPVPANRYKVVVIG